MKCKLFCIADFYIKIILLEDILSEIDLFSLISSFETFAVSDSNNINPLFTLTIYKNLRAETSLRHIKTYDTGNGKIKVRELPFDGCQFVIRDTLDRDCCLLQTSCNYDEYRCALNGTQEMRAYGLNSALMIAFSVASARQGGLLMHASCVSYKGYAYPFLAESGTGKSTHADFWMKNIEGVQLLNDDSPIIRTTKEGIWVYGSPWSGKTSCYRNRRFLLGALVKIERATKNEIEKQRIIDGFMTLLTSCSSLKWDKKIYEGECDTITYILERIPVYVMKCLPNNEAALVCQKIVTVNS